MLSVVFASRTRRVKWELHASMPALFETFIFLPHGFQQTLRHCFADYGLGLMNIITILFQHNKENLVIINSQKPVYLFT